jgi:hypothetical protein
MRAIPELVTMVKGMAAALRSVGSTLFLLLVALYVLGIVAQSQLADLNPTDYGTVLKSALILFIGGTLFDDAISIMEPLLHHKPLTAFLSILLYFVVVLFAGFMLLNMLIGVVNQVVSAVSKNEAIKLKAIDIRFKMEEVYNAEVEKQEEAYEAAMGYREEMDDTVTRAMYMGMLQHDDFRSALAGNGITPDHYETVANTLFLTEDQEPRTLNFEEEFIVEIAELSPLLSASVMHAQDLRLFGRTSIKAYKAMVDDKMGRFDRGQDLVIDRIQRQMVRARRNQRKRTVSASRSGLASLRASVMSGGKLGSLLKGAKKPGQGGSTTSAGGSAADSADNSRRSSHIAALTQQLKAAAE